MRMASIRKLPSGKFNVRITRKGYPVQTKSFLLRTYAERYARLIKSQWDMGVLVDRSEAEDTTLATALIRYSKEITPKKRGAAQEQRRISQSLRTNLAKRSLASLHPADFAKYRDSRLADGKAATAVRRGLVALEGGYRHLRLELGEVIPPLTSCHALALSHGPSGPLVGQGYYLSRCPNFWGRLSRRLF
jgi:hypothetical protein